MKIMTMKFMNILKNHEHYGNHEKDGKHMKTFKHESLKSLKNKKRENI